jgi:hypothetical protein
VAALGLLAVTAWSAPGPTDAPPVKTPDGGVAAEPAGGDDEAAARHRDASVLNLKQFAIAVHSYADDHNGRLPRDVTDKDGKPVLSWRVHLLPYPEHADLHKQFKLDQPWDSDHNKRLLAKMPKVFASPRVRVKEAGHTVYQGFAGPGSVFEPGRERGLADITDGLSNTVLAVEASVAVAWTKPADLPFAEKKDLPDFGKAYAATPLAVLCDGSVRTLDLTRVSATTLKAAITTAGGEVLGADW